MPMVHQLALNKSLDRFRRFFIFAAAFVLVLSLFITTSNSTVNAVDFESRILYSDGDTNQITSIRPDGTDAQVLASGFQVDVSPDGQKIAYQRGGNVYVADKTGANELNITADLPNNNRTPSWSSDSSQILFTSERPGTPNTGLYTRNSDGTGEQLILAIAFDGSYSPDGTKIAHGCVSGGATELCVSDSDGTNTIPITDSSLNGERFPKWSSDSNTLAFEGSVPGQPLSIFTANSDGTNVQTIVTAPAGRSLGTPTWSPDSNQLTFTANFPPAGFPVFDRLFVIDAVPGATAQEIVTTRVQDQVDWSFIDNDPPAILCNSEVVTIEGTEDDDILMGTEGVDVIHGLGGNDVIYGLGEDDVICGGNGNDTIEAGAGRDDVFGENGNDTIFGNGGRDDLFGGSGDDSIDGGSGNDTIEANGGFDTVRGANGNDTIRGGGGNDTVDGGDGDDTLNGNGGNDVLKGGMGTNTCSNGELVEECV